MKYFFGKQNKCMLAIKEKREETDMNELIEIYDSIAFNCSKIYNFMAPSIWIISIKNLICIHCGNHPIHECSNLRVNTITSAITNALAENRTNYSFLKVSAESIK